MLELICVLVSILFSFLACNIIFAGIYDVYFVSRRFKNKTPDPYLRGLDKIDKNLSYIIAYLSVVAGIFEGIMSFGSIFIFTLRLSYPSFEATFMLCLDALFIIISYLFGKQVWHDAKNNAKHVKK